jgi:hypothetical protein
MQRVETLYAFSALHCSVAPMMTTQTAFLAHFKFRPGRNPHASGVPPGHRPTRGGQDACSAIRVHPPGCRFGISSGHGHGDNFIGTPHSPFRRV